MIGSDFSDDLVRPVPYENVFALTKLLTAMLKSYIINVREEKFEISNRIFD